MKPVISPEMQKLALRMLGAALVALGMLQSWDWKSAISAIVAAVGGVLAGTANIGPGQIDMKELPRELRDTLRPPPLP